MKPSFLLLSLNLGLAPALAISSASAAPDQPPVYFGKQPKSQAAKDFRATLAKIHKEQGTDKAIDYLEKEGPRFLNSRPPHEQYDFLNGITDEAVYRGESTDYEFSGKLLSWVYHYARFEGNELRRKIVVPTLYRHLYQTGQYAESREILSYELVRLAEITNSDTNISLLPTGKPEHADFPIFKLKHIPRKHHAFLDFQTGEFLALLSKQLLAEGQWLKAMETASVPIYRGRGPAKSKKENLTARPLEKLDTWRIAMSSLIEAYHVLGITELELRDSKKLAESNQTIGSEWPQIIKAKARVIFLECKLGTIPLKQAITELEGLKKTTETTKKFTRDDHYQLDLMKAQLYFYHQDNSQGWSLIEHLREVPDASFNTRFMVDKEECRQLIAEKKLTNVESKLLQLLETCRTGGIKREEIDLYKIYVDFLVAAGRYDEAVIIQHEQLRLLDTFNIFPRKPQALRKLAEIYALMGDRRSAKDSLRSAQAVLSQHVLPKGFVTRTQRAISRSLPTKDAEYEQLVTYRTDLQPRNAIMAPIEGMPTRGLFTLTNSQNQDVSGTLALTGKGISVSSDSDQGVTSILLGTSEGKDQVTLPMTLSANSQEFLDIEQDSTSDKTAELQLVWTPENGKKISAQWKAEAEIKGENITIVDAAEYHKNPFYLIPFYHLIQNKDDFQKSLDLRIVASQPTRIEIYDQNDAIIAVDAEGDGSITGPHDMLAQDLNKNGLPDLKLESGQHENRFRYFINPKGEIPEEGITIALEIRLEGQWTKVSEDRLMAQ